MTSFEDFLTVREAASTAFVDGDPGPLLAISAHGDPATIYPPSGVTVQGAHEVNAGNTAGAGTFTPGAENRFEVLHAGSDGDLGYWTGIQYSVVHPQDVPQPVPMTLRVTELFRRENGQWRLFHRHADPLAAPDHAQARTWSLERREQAHVDPDAVWRAWFDVPNWPKWNSDIARIELTGPFIAGSSIAMTLRDGDTIDLHLAEVEEGRLFVDQAEVAGTTIRTLHRIDRLDDGRTQVTYRLTATGPNAENIGRAVSADFTDTIQALLDYTRR